MTNRNLPGGTLIGFYGDDFTGSTSVMEALTFAGLPTALFLGTPTAERLAKFTGYRGIGIAGIARSQDKAWMSAHLPEAFRVLAALEAPVTHYKVCSTFDSSPHVGSIGYAIDLAVPILGGAWHPLLVATPEMGRYQAFGNLFALAGETIYRLDRHPTMARHPVTPMDEADLRRHLSRQTDRSIGLVDLLAMKSGEGDSCLQRECERGAEIVALDVIDRETLVEAGRIIWDNCGKRLFGVGSQGLEYALIAHWREAGLLGESRAEDFRSARAERIFCVSGSCSPVTAGQIAHAERECFATIRLDVVQAVNSTTWEAEIERAAAFALRSLGEGYDPLAFTAFGPDDPALSRLAEAIATSGTSATVVNDRIGAGLGRLLDRVMRAGGVTRAVIAGGDTSGHAALALGVHALTAVSPIAPGAPLCRAHSDDPAHANVEIVLKGGQVGAPDFFCAVREGSG